MDMWQKTSAPSTNIILTGLRIFTEYNVSVAAATMAGVGPFDSVTVQTLNDSKQFCITERLYYICTTSPFFIACSEPLGVMFTDVGETTVSLEWSESAVPNGIVESYLVSQFHLYQAHVWYISCYFFRFLTKLRAQLQTVMLSTQLLLRQNQFSL